MAIKKVEQVSWYIQCDGCLMASTGHHNTEQNARYAAIQTGIVDNGKEWLCEHCRTDIKTCNSHANCDAADEKVKAEGKYLRADHCYDDCCEDCFGS